MSSEWVAAVDNIHTYIYLPHYNIGTRWHGMSSSFCAGIEYDVYRCLFNLGKCDVMLVDRQRVNARWTATDTVDG